MSGFSQGLVSQGMRTSPSRQKQPRRRRIVLPRLFLLGKGTTASVPPPICRQTPGPGSASLAQGIFRARAALRERPAGLSGGGGGILRRQIDKVRVIAVDAAICLDFRPGSAVESVRPVITLAASEARDRTAFARSSVCASGRVMSMRFRTALQSPSQCIGPLPGRLLCRFAVQTVGIT